MTQAVVHFRWMGAFWSCTPAMWDQLQSFIHRSEGFDLEAIGARELRSRPKGKIQQLRDIEPRGPD